MRQPTRATATERGFIAWGGVVAQALLLAGTFAGLALLGKPRTPFVAELVSVFTFTNLWLIALNLLPVPVLDGGHLMYYLWEAVTGKPVEGVWLERLQHVGMFLLLSMVAIAMFNDITQRLG